MAKQKTIEWTGPMLKRFKGAYSRALKDQRDTFKFNGNKFLVRYAKYLIEYLEGKIH